MSDTADKYSEALQKEGMDKKEADQRAAKVVDRATKAAEMEAGA